MAQHHYYTPPPIRKAQFTQHEDDHQYWSTNGQVEGLEEEYEEQYEEEQDWQEHPWNINPSEEPIAYTQTNNQLPQRKQNHQQTNNQLQST